MRQLYATLLRKRRLHKQITNDELLLESLNEQAENIRKSLSGLSEADTNLLAAKSSYDRAEEALEIWVSDVGAIGSAIDDMESAVSDLPTKSEARADDLPEGATLAEIEKEVADHVSTVKKAVEDMKHVQSELMADDGALKGTLATNVSKWNKALATFNERYAEAKGRASAHESRLEQLGQLEKRIAELRNMIARTRREFNGLGKPDAQYAQVRETWIRTKEERARLVQQECEKLTTRSQGEIRANIRVGAGVEAVVQKFRAAVGGSGLRREKIDAVGELVRNAQDADRKWIEVLGELDGLAGYDPQESGERMYRLVRS